MECDQLYHTQAALREKLHSQIVHIVDEVVTFKLHIQTALENYEERTESELADFEGRVASDSTPMLG